ncbi:MAG: His-Xaa-Ser system protein HxsD [Mitsuokella sp.]
MTKEIQVLKSIYPPQVMMKSAYMFLDRVYVHITEDENTWTVHFAAKGAELPVNIGEEFENVLIAQAVRGMVYQKTHHLREMLLARAMTSSIVDTGNPLKQIKADQQTDDEELADILEDWFEKHE